MNIEEALSQAKLYIRQNQKEQARGILSIILQENPNHAEAWLLSAHVCDELKQVQYCLQRALKINPNILESYPNAPHMRDLIKSLNPQITPPPPPPESRDLKKKN